MNDPRNILSHARGMMIEQIMALAGRGRPNARAFRSELESESSVQLAHRLERLRDSTISELRTPISTFPALQETTDDIPSALRRSGASTPARELLTLQSTLP